MQESVDILHHCPVCRGEMVFYFNGEILGKYTISYYCCNNCGLIRTEKPFWLDEAYSTAIADLDVGLVNRNIRLSKVLRWIICNWFDSKSTFLDYAGGYGFFVRLMRNYGIDFHRYDKYCPNIFAKHFECAHLDRSDRYELVTAFEVFEHLFEPVEEITSVFDVTDSILFSTEFLPKGIENIGDWRYFSPETGQHLTFYTLKSLKILAERLSVNYYYDNSGNGEALHLFTKKNLSEFSFYPKVEKRSFLNRLWVFLKGSPVNSKKIAVHYPKSLEEEDYAYIKSLIVKK